MIAFPNGGCSPIAPAQCGTEAFGNCLKCGDSGSYDCEECCPSCKQVSKADWKFCECSKPGPGPFPPPGGDSWEKYEVAGMAVESVVGGTNRSNYEKVVILLHGGGGSGSDWQYQYTEGWFGDLAGMKYVFPTSALQGHVWYESFKNGCGLSDDCAYNISTIKESAARVAALIEREKALVGGSNSKVYLAGFSQGAQLTGYLQLAKLDFALGGTIVMDGFPLPPLCDMPGQESHAAKKNATYYGTDMKWMIYHGAADQIFPVNETLTAWNGIFEVLGVRSTVKIQHVEPNMYHTVIKPEFDMMVKFVTG